MQEPLARDARLALDLALTVRHDGHGGVADDLADPAGLTTWVRAHPETVPDAAAFVADQASLTAVRDLRGAVRALFAHAVRPAEPSRADAARLLPVPEAVACLNAAAARTSTVPVLHWPEGAEPAVHRKAADDAHDLTGTLAHAAIAFLAGPRPRPAAAARLPRTALRALFPQGAPAPGVVQTLLRQPRTRRPPPRPAQDRPGVVTVQPTWMCLFIPSCL